MIKRDGLSSPSHIIAQSFPKTLLRVSDDLWYSIFNAGKMITVNDEVFIEYMTSPRAKKKLGLGDLKRQGTHEFANVRNRIGYKKDKFVDYVLIEEMLSFSQKKQDEFISASDLELKVIDSSRNSSLVLESDLGLTQISQELFIYMENLSFDKVFYENNGSVYFRNNDKDVGFVSHINSH